MKRKGMYLISAVFFIFIMFTLFDFNYVKADINGVTVTPLIEDGNSDITDRFQILGDNDKVRTLKLSIGNFGTRKLRLRVVPTNATTSMDGKIVYTDNVKVGQYGLKYAFADMTKPQTILLRPNRTKDLVFKVKLPNEKIKGLILGGFNIYDVSKVAPGNSNVPVWITDDNKPVGGY
ncbi:WxL protein peptidoglycan domain-containing protein [Companilactobacillus nuruki]|uniref:WxL Interacting Protein peptidoglycan binding domain-containing protein n=1 Tax=Companilactobacillus nuruki TaxID=1993540 RepID=A0A2N7AT30_9LACO|nr:DUF916 domain-containing protein [Companilactobacillus nuruki]PMD68845.1 hypothetical protein CBP76_09090 [Companilactobacillus nuruki]